MNKKGLEIRARLVLGKKERRYDEERVERLLEKVDSLLEEKSRTQGERE